MRIAFAGISHETNTYCSGTTDTTDFYQLRGAAMFNACGQESDVGGALDRCRAVQCEAVPLLFVSAQPSGIISARTYTAFKEEILQGLKRESFDAVVLLLHGAGVVEGLSDLEGDLAAAVRDCVGANVPVAASFDLHGNVSSQMTEALDGIFACHHYPHVDLHERAAEAVDLVVRMHRTGLQTSTHIVSLPMLLPTTTTYEGIGQAMLERLLDAEGAHAGIIDASWFHGFPYADTPHVGSHIVVTSEARSAQAAQTLATNFAEALWEERAAFTPTSLSAPEAIKQALAIPKSGQPVVINETSDNCGAGTPGDGTHLLRAMLDAQLEDACFGFIVDPVVASAAQELGVGQRFAGLLGAKTDTLHGEPLKVNGYIKSLHDGRLTLQAMFRGSPLKLGSMARLVIEGIDVIVASRRSQTFDPEPFLALGIDVSRYRYVALKSSNHFRAGFADIAGTIITADPPGLSTHHIETFARAHAGRPMWPIDAAAVNF